MTLNNRLEELDNMKASQEIKDKTLKYIMSKQKKKNYIPLSIVLIMSCLIIGFLTFQNQPMIDPSPIAYISLDINPSLEIELDSDYKVIKVNTYNEDAKSIVQESEIQGLDVQEAIQVLLKNQEYTTYLEEGILEVGIYSPDKTISSKLENMVNQYIGKQLSREQYHCSQVNQETYKNAGSHHMSSGKYRIIEDILSYTQDYTIANLNDLSIRELYEILGQYNQQAVPKGCRDRINQQGKHHLNKAHR